MSVRPTKLIRAGAIAAGVLLLGAGVAVALRHPGAGPSPAAAKSAFQPRENLDSSGFRNAIATVPRWKGEASLQEVAAIWKGFGYREAARADRQLASSDPAVDRAAVLLYKAIYLNYEGSAEKAYAALEQARALAEADPARAREKLYTLIYYQGVTALRIGETENCVQCRGNSACILPIKPEAVHRKPRGSRLAIRHFTEYLQQFPDDLEVRWLLNLAHMTLGDYPNAVEPKYRLSIDRFLHSEFNIGRFEDIGYRVGVDRANEAGGAVMDDFDNDGRLDLVLTSFDPGTPMVFYRNTGTGHFEDATRQAGLTNQIGGLTCVQADYDNDGNLDLFVPRGAWLNSPVRPSLLKNDGHGHFTDVTAKCGLAGGMNSNAACWADYDNDGHLDLFVCGEKQPNRLYRNLGDGTFRDVAGPAGLLGTREKFCKGATWIDFDRDDYPDLFVNYLDGSAHLFRNNRHGGFEDVTAAMGIDGPVQGFSCWSFDFDNDGWPDLFATSYDRSTADVVRGLIGQPHHLHTSKLYRNVNGKHFEDVTKQAGLDAVYATMGSNFADFDNDGFLDFYLSTGEPNLGTLVPNRMFWNVDGKRFADITGTSGTGHLQKGHAVACGDWDRDGNVDLFVELGGAIPGDGYHDVLFQNPGHSNRWITLKLVGAKTNRSAIGAEIAVVTSGRKPLTVYRTVSSGSSFGANPLQQTIGIGAAEKIDRVEVHWPTSHTGQVFRGLPVNQAFELRELDPTPHPLHWSRLPVPKSTALVAIGK